MGDHVLEERCIIQFLVSDDIAFLGRDSQYTEDIQEAAIFKSMLEVQLYIEKNRLDRIGKIRKIKCSSIKRKTMNRSCCWSSV